MTGETGVLVQPREMYAKGSIPSNTHEEGRVTNAIRANAGVPNLAIGVTLKWVSKRT